LDGISGAILGVLTALVTADITHGSGRFNLAQGIIGTASGIGAALSTALFGLIAANFDRTAAFLSMAAVALLGASILWLLCRRQGRRPRSNPSLADRTSPNDLFCLDRHTSLPIIKLLGSRRGAWHELEDDSRRQGRQHHLHRTDSRSGSGGEAALH